MGHMAKLIFVYGTLMEGMRNHSYMEGAKLVGPAETKPEFELVTNGSIPAVRAGSEAVRGELYEADDAFIEQLEQWAEIGTGLYDRRETDIGDKQAIIYLGGERMFGSDTWEKIPNGDYKAYVASQEKTTG